MAQTILLQAGAEAQGGSILAWLPMILVLGAMFFFMNRSNKKQQREAQQLRDSLQVGDEIVTIGGIVGRIVKLEQDTILLESGPDRSKFRMNRDAISYNNTASERKADEQKANQAKMDEEKAKKKEAKKNK